MRLRKPVLSLFLFSTLFTGCKENVAEPAIATKCTMPGPKNADTTSFGWTNIAPENHMSQSFKSNSSCFGTIEVGITTMNRGRGGDQITLLVISPNKSVLFQASQNVPEGFDGWLRYEIPSPLSVAEGNTLFIELKDTGKIVFGWKYSRDTYPDGSAIRFGVTDPNDDYLFKINDTQ